MKLVLFIGHHKVGSTALQSYLAANAVALLRTGVLYPAVESEGLSTLLALAMGKSDFPTHLLPVNFREGHNALGFGMLAETEGRRPVPVWHENLPPSAEMLRNIRNQIEVFRPDTVILAAEVFAHFAVLAPNAIRQLAEVFEDADIHLTATLRRIDDYLVSWQGQRLRFGEKPLRLCGKALNNYVQTVHFDYRRMLQGWMDAFPRAAIQLRTYDQVLANGGAVQDFLKQNKIAPVRRRPIEMQANKGLHRGLFEIARRANAALDHETAKFLFLTLLEIGDQLGLPNPKDIEMFGARNRAELYERFEPVHVWLSQISMKAPFFDNQEKVGQLLPHAEIDVNRAALSAIRSRWMPEFEPGARAFLESINFNEPNE